MPSASARPRQAFAAAALLALLLGSAAHAVEVVRLTPSDPGAQSFGAAAALDGDTAAVSDQRLSNSAVFIFERDAGGPGAWAETAKVEDPGGGIFSFFGTAVELQGDRLAVISNEDPDLDQGVAYIFERDVGGPDAWGLVASLTTPEEQQFGALAMDGDTLVVGWYFAGDNAQGAAYVFERDAGGPGEWGQVATLSGDGGSFEEFGDSLALEGDTLLVGAPGRTFIGRGAVFVFERDAGGPGAWGRVAKIENPPDPINFGWQVTLRGDTALVSARNSPPYTTRVYRFERDPVDPALWTPMGQVSGEQVLDGDNFGWALASDGDLAVVGAQSDRISRGSVQVFARDAGGPGDWGQGAFLTLEESEPYDFFGRSVAVSGREVLAGAIGEDDDVGAAYLFDLTTLGPYLTVGGDCPGTVSVDLAVAEPETRILLAGSVAPGSFVLPGGSCAGLELGLASPRLLTELTSDELGNASLEVDLGEGPCGAYLQAVVAPSCLPSGVDRLPQRRSALSYDAGAPADFFVPSDRAWRWVGNVFDTALGSPLDGGSLSAVQVYLRDAGTLLGRGFMGVLPYPATADATVELIDELNVQVPEDGTFATYVLAAPLDVPPGFMLGQLLYEDCGFYCYKTGGSLGFDADTAMSQGFHAFQIDFVDDGIARGFQRMDANAMLRARGGFAAPLLPVELAPLGATANAQTPSDTARPE